MQEKGSLSPDPVAKGTKAHIHVVSLRTSGHQSSPVQEVHRENTPLAAGPLSPGTAPALVPGAAQSVTAPTEAAAKAGALVPTGPGDSGTEAMTGAERRRRRRSRIASGPMGSARSYCPLDGHVNSLRLFRTLHTAINARGVRYLPSHRVDGISREGGMFGLATTRGEVRAARVALAAGNANMRLAPMVGLEAPMRPERGQIVVTERLRPFLNYPVVTLRQTDEGTVMIGDFKEESTDPRGLTSASAPPRPRRAVRQFPLLAGVNVVRTWSASG